MTDFWHRYWLFAVMIVGLILMWTLGFLAGRAG